MLARTPLKRKRETPRRNEGRVQHKRIKPQVAVEPNATEKRHHDRLRRMGCLVCGANEVDIHHVKKVPGAIRNRDHRFVAPLCRNHHTGNAGIHGHYSGHRFEEAYGIDLIAFALRAWEDSNGATEVF